MAVLKRIKLFFPVSSRYVSYTTLQFCEPAQEYKRVDFSQLATIPQLVPERILGHDILGTKCTEELGEDIIKLYRTLF